jgi:ATP-dependent exoDNAse (exonuclease V) beta subunit
MFWELELSHLEDLSDPGLYVPTVLDAISRAKDELRDPKEFETLAQEWVEAAEDSEERETAEKALEAAKVYAAYQWWLAADGRVDYGDLIRLTLQILELPGVGDEIKDRYSHVLVDEFQDINFASGRLLKAIDGHRGIVWAVADPDQSIYRFRGGFGGQPRSLRRRLSRLPRDPARQELPLGPGHSRLMPRPARRPCRRRRSRCPYPARGRPAGIGEAGGLSHGDA